MFMPVNLKNKKEKTERNKNEYKMKKLFSKIVMFAAFATLITYSVQCTSQTVEKKAEGNIAKTSKSDSALPNYRYVDGDSILAAYNLSKDYTEEMLRMQTNFDNTARQRESAIQNFANKMQQKMQNNEYLTQESFKQDEQKLAQMQNSAQTELAKLQNNMQNAGMEAQKIVNDSINSYIKEYNKKYGYDAILFKAATLYIDPKLDITQDVIKGLNARYNNVKK